MNFQRRKAFTLIELLVARSIITLLIAILLPVLTAARKVAERTQYLANVRWHEIAFETFRRGERVRGGYLFTPFN